MRQLFERPARDCAGRSGNILILFAMLLFGIMAFAALVIDIGYARLTQRQMQLAADNAALESLRQFDVEPGNTSVYTGRTAAANQGRRQAAVDIVSAVFDDDFDSSSDGRNFGAGPQVVLSGGVPLQDGFLASQDLSLPTTPVYKPELELNTSNDPSGDIVASDSTLLVRIQRNADGASAGVSSNGGALPFLFGRGTLMPWDNRAAGIALTVTTTAETAPVVRVGERQTLGTTIPGGIGFGLSRTVWESLLANTPTTTPLAGGSVGTTATTLTQIGESATIVAGAFAGDGYCPIVESIDGSPRVIGFGWVTITDPMDGVHVAITKHRDPTAAETIAPENATAYRRLAWEVLGALSPADRDAVVAANQSFSDPLVSVVLQPGGP